MFSCVCPHAGEELWQILGHEGSLAYEPWPVFDPEAVREDEVEIAVQINGKVRATVTIPRSASQEEALAAGRQALQGKLTGTVVKEVYVPGRIVKIVMKP